MTPVKSMCSSATCAHCSKIITQGQPAVSIRFKKQKKFLHPECFKQAQKKKALAKLNQKDWMLMGNVKTGKTCLCEICRVTMPKNSSHASKIGASRSPVYAHISCAFP